MDFHEFKMDYLKKALPPLAEREMKIKIRKMKFIGGGSYGKVFKVETEDGRIFALKAYRRKKLNEREVYQLRNMWGDMYGIYDTYKKYAELSDNCDFKIAYYGFVNEIKCFRNSGEDFAIWRGIWSRRLRKELSKF